MSTLALDLPTAPVPTTAPVSAADTTADLMARLRRHYIKPGAPLPGGVFLPEVGWNGTANFRRVDALYVGFTGTSGRILIGHEVKASRADWVKELDSPGKADQWADQCHEWWLVTAPDVVRPGELPDGWGHMVPGKSRTRMTVLTRATRHRDRTPSWDATRSILARQDTLRAQAIEDGRRKATDDMWTRQQAAVDAALERERATQATEDTARVRLALIEAALGGTIHDADTPTPGYRFRGHRTTRDLAEVATLLRVHGDVQTAARALRNTYRNGHLTRFREALDMLDAAANAACDSLPPDYR